MLTIMIVHILSHTFTRLIMCTAAHLQQYFAALQIVVSDKCNNSFTEFNPVLYNKYNEICPGLRPGIFALMPLHSLISKSVKNEF
jgi:hypothetical protein